MTNENTAPTQPKIKWQDILPLLFFVVYFAAGLLIFDDYGVSSDEGRQNIKAQYNLEYISGKSDTLLTYNDRYYGVVLAIPMYIYGNWVNDPRTDYLSRHLLTFLIFFGSAILLYKTLRRLGFTWVFSLLGVSMYILQPHIFSHSFYNIKDIPFLALFTTAIYCQVRWLQQPNTRNLLLTAFVAGLLVVFRIQGFVFWVAFALTILLTLAVVDFKKMLLAGAIFVGVALASLYVLMPAMWSDPINGLATFLSLKLFEWKGKELFEGTYFVPADLPFYYIPKYIAITTPLMFVGVMLTGAGTWLLRLFKQIQQRGSEWILGFNFLFLAAFPMLLIMITKPNIYNGWRHAFFIYAPLVILGVYGARWLWELANHTALSAAMKQAASTTLILLWVVQTIFIGKFYIESHPFEHVYYNALAGNSLAKISSQYSMDYWGLCYRASMEKILAEDSKPVIPITSASDVIIGLNYKLLTSQQQQRLQLVNMSDHPDYYITHFRYGQNEQPDGYTLESAITVEDANICGIYKKNP